MIVTFPSFKPRSKKAILEQLRKDGLDMPVKVLKILASIAHEFDCMVRDTSEELDRVRKDLERLKKENEELSDELYDYRGH